MYQTESDRLSRDPSNWRWYFLYFCPRDPRLIVPKRLRALGWTINLARPMAIPFLVLVIALVWAVSILPLPMVPTPVALGGKLLVILGVIALCRRLSRPRD